MNTIFKLICIVYIVACVWAAPALNNPTVQSGSFGMKPMPMMCPMVMCAPIQQPCDNIQMSYMTINGQQCPGCRYCATPLATTDS
ncbi:unnamed protein product [Adineta steineri]|uniref:Uncharacterized protein n=1 Tax=Adineta steineri TaxID=433720 RepID=A0A819W150_9BILA|nr:unnamed protein product [Adineta steineri]CAF4117520.1 unnamed protein product [Adineta steineri]